MQNTCKHQQADARTRTGDPFITSEVLYQLSYVGGPGRHGTERRRPRFYSGMSSRSTITHVFVSCQSSAMLVSR